MSEEEKIQDEVREDGRTRAFFAVQKDKDGSCMELIECLDAGVDPNAVDIQGDTALHWACWNLKRRPMEVLLERGALPNVGNYKGDTPLHHVITKERNQHTYEMACRLLDAGADALMANAKGDTAFHVLMTRSRMLHPQEAMGIVQLLSEKCGTDGWFLENKLGETPLDIARKVNDPNVAVFVSGMQASILEQDTPLIQTKPGTSRRL